MDRQEYLDWEIFWVAPSPSKGNAQCGRGFENFHDPRRLTGITEALRYRGHCLAALARLCLITADPREGEALAGANVVDADASLESGREWPELALLADWLATNPSLTTLQLVKLFGNCNCGC